MTNIKLGDKAGILVYNLDDAYAADEMQKAKNVNSITGAIFDYFNKLRSIRKYDSVEYVSGTDEDLTEELKEAIQKSENYYRMLLVQCLEEHNANQYID